MRARVADMGLVVSVNSGVLGTVTIGALQAWANLTLVLFSIAFTIWRWFRVAHKTLPAKKVGERPGAEIRQDELEFGD